MNKPRFSEACISDMEVTPKGVSEIRWTSLSLSSQSLESLVVQEPGPAVEPIHLTSYCAWIV